MMTVKIKDLKKNLKTICEKYGFNSEIYYYNTGVRVYIEKNIGDDLIFKYTRFIPFILRVSDYSCNEDFVIISIEDKKEHNWRKIRDKFVGVLQDELERWVKIKNDRIEKLLTMYHDKKE